MTEYRDKGHTGHSYLVLKSLGQAISKYHFYQTHLFDKADQLVNSILGGKTM